MPYVYKTSAGKWPYPSISTKVRPAVLYPTNDGLQVPLPKMGEWKANKINLPVRKRFCDVTVQTPDGNRNQIIGPVVCWALAAALCPWIYDQGMSTLHLIFERLPGGTLASLKRKTPQANSVITSHGALVPMDWWS